MIRSPVIHYHYPTPSLVFLLTVSEPTPQSEQLEQGSHTSAINLHLHCAVCLMRNPQWSKLFKTFFLPHKDMTSNLFVFLRLFLYYLFFFYFKSIGYYQEIKLRIITNREKLRFPPVRKSDICSISVGGWQNYTAQPCACLTSSMNFCTVPLPATVL